MFLALVLVSSLSMARPALAAPACVDTDGGIVPDVAGSITISAPAMPQTLTDTCLNLVVTTNGLYTTGQWVPSNTGTHVSEFSCADITTGAYTDTVIACTYGCNLGACNPAPVVVPTVTPTPAPIASTGKKVESKGIINSVNSDSIIVGGSVLRVLPETVVKYNEVTDFAVGLKVQYKGIRNTDGSVSLTSIEVN